MAGYLIVDLESEEDHVTFGGLDSFGDFGGLAYLIFMELKDASRLLSTPLLTKVVSTHWADLGCGAGVFTHALSTHLAPGSTILAVDLNNTLQPNPVKNDVTIDFRGMNFETQTESLPSLNGILLANALHFVADPSRLLRILRQKLMPGGLFMLVEYELTTASRWVPYPVPFSKAKVLFQDVGFSATDRIGEHPSLFHRGKIYSCIAQL